MRRTKWLTAAVCAAMATLATASSPSSDEQVFFYDDVESSAVASLLSPQDRDVFNATGDFDHESVWQRYFGYVMSPQRAAPLVVLFTDDNCDDLIPPRRSLDGGDDDNDQSGDDLVLSEELRATCEQIQQHAATVVAAVDDVFSTTFKSVLPVVRISRQHLPQAFDKHRIPTSPSLMWFPPRSRGRFQRFAHPLTNFLDLTTDAVAKLPPQKGTLKETITRFVYRGYSLSALQPTASTSGSLVNQILETDAYDTITAGLMLNAVLIVAVVLYSLASVAEYRALALKVIKSRSTWFVFNELVMFVALSGLLHSIIVRAQLFYFHPHYGFYLVHPSGRKQFILEGFINGSWYFLVSLALFNVVDLIPHVRSRYVRDEVFRLSLMGVGAIYMTLHVVFMSKHGWMA